MAEYREERTTAIIEVVVVLECRENGKYHWSMPVIWKA